MTFSGGGASAYERTKIADYGPVIQSLGSHVSFVPVVADMLGAFGASTTKLIARLSPRLGEEIGFGKAWAATLMRLLLANAVGIATARLLVDARRRLRDRMDLDTTQVAFRSPVGTPSRSRSESPCGTSVAEAALASAAALMAAAVR